MVEPPGDPLWSDDESHPWQEGVDRPVVWLDAVEGRSGWFSYLFDVLGTTVSGGWGGVATYGRSPRVEVVNRHGKRVVVLEAKTYEEAVEERDRLEQELQDIGLTAWCQRYQVREAWAEGF